MHHTDGQPRGRQGFASMDPVRQREIASRGGKACSPENRSFSRNRELASEAGRKGGKAIKPENRTFARDPEKAREAGRKGGLAKRVKRASASAERAP